MNVDQKKDAVPVKYLLLRHQPPPPPPPPPPLPLPLLLDLSLIVTNSAPELKMVATWENVAFLFIVYARITDCLKWSA